MNDTWPPYAAWLLHSMVGGGLLLLLALPLMAVCRQPARRQRVGEMSLLAALLLCVLSLGPSWITVPLPNTEMSAPPPAASESPSLSGSLVLPVPNQPGEETELPEGYFSQSGLAAEQDHEEVTGPENAPAVPEFSAPQPSPLSRWLRIVAVAYGAASALLLARWLVGHVALWRLLRAAQPAPEAINHVFEKMTRGPSRRPRLLLCKRLRVPLSCGLLRPCVIVPASLSEPKAGRTLRWVFAHELTHLERGDAWSCVLFGLGQLLYFYLPWFWWLRRHVRLCQEYIADAAAAEQTGEPEDYAQFLVSLTQAPAVPLGTLGVLGNSSDLFRRVTMLLQSPIRVERCCPRWWSLAAAGGLLGLALLVSGIGLRADAADSGDGRQRVTALAVDPSETPNADEKEEQPAEKKKSKNKAAVDKVLLDLDDLLKELPSAVDAEQLKRLQEQLKQMQTEMENAAEPLKKFGRLDVLREHLDLDGNDPAGRLLLGQDWSQRQHEGRLGVRVQKPSSVLAEQLDLPKGQGLVIEHVLPQSAAAKAGLKVHDLLLEFEGKPVPDDVAKFIKMLDAIKANTPVDVVVLRKGKKETIKGLSLPEAKGKQRFQFKAAPGTAFVPAQPGGPFRFQLGQPDILLPGTGGPGSHGVITTIFRTKDSFNTRYQEGSLVITVTGGVADGKSKVKQIEIQDGGKNETYERLDKVPEQYRDKVKSLIEMSEKTNLKIEVGKANNGDNKGTLRTWKIGPLEHANARDVSRTIKELYQEHLNNTLSVIKNGSLRNKFLDTRPIDLAVDADDQTNTMFVTCSESTYKWIKKLAESLDASAKESLNQERELKNRNWIDGIPQEQEDKRKPSRLRPQFSRALFVI